MYFLRALKVALSSLAANKLRSVLAVLGIVIGVSAVITMLGMGKGAQASVEKSISKLGVNLIFVWAGNVSRGFSHSRSSFAETLVLDDAEAVKQIPHVAGVAPEARRYYQAKYLNRNNNVRVVGTTPDHPSLRDYVVERGEYFDQTAMQARLRVCVLGSQVARDLFGDIDPVGRQIQIEKKNFQVVGVMSEKGGDHQAQLDDSIYVPVSTLFARLTSRRYLSQITVSVDEPSNVDEVKQALMAEFLKRHKITGKMTPDFTIGSMNDMLEQSQQATGAFTVLLAGIALVSLFVGGIGIMNIMLVSVTERTREIGIRKAIGARRSDIVKQFLIESVTISLMGGLLGILVGIVGAQVIPKLSLWKSLSRGAEWSSEISPESIVVSFLFSCVVGVFFGIYPALKASRLHPVDALRSM